MKMKMKRRTFMAGLLVGALLVTLTATLTISARTAQTAQGAQPANQLVFVGDSLSEGLFATQHSLDYVFQTAAMTGYSISVQAQYGVTAVFTAQKMQTTANAGSTVVPTNSVRVVIELGTNDVQAILDGTETLADF